LASITTQTFTDYEILLIDDGSTDSSPEICDNFAQKDDRFRVIHKINTGAYDSRNIGLKAALGDYIIFVDADDLLPNKASLNRIYEALISQNEIDVLGVNAEKIQGKKCFVRRLTPAPAPILGDLFLKNQLINKTYYVAIWQYVCRKQFIIQNNLSFLEAKHGSDKLWVAQILHRANHVVTLDVEHYRYVKRPNSITTSESSVEKINSHLTVSQALYHGFVNVDDHELKLLMMSQIAGAFFSALVHAHKLGEENLIDHNFLKNPLFIKNKYMPFRRRLKIFICNLDKRFIKFYYQITRLRYFLKKNKFSQKKC
jgi:glycosyltransferase involved in cell wall biosynthesis